MQNHEERWEEKLPYHLLVPSKVLADYCNKHGLKQQEFILSQFWKIEVQNQGVGRAIISLKAPGEDPSLPPPGSWGWQAIEGEPGPADASLQCLPLSSHSLLCVCLCAYAFSSSKDTS